MSVCDLDAQSAFGSQQIRTSWGLCRKAKLQVCPDPQTPTAVHEIQRLNKRTFEPKRHPDLKLTGSLGEM